MNFSVPYNTRHFLINRATVSELIFSEKLLSCVRPNVFGVQWYRVWLAVAEHSFRTVTSGRMLCSSFLISFYIWLVPRDRVRLFPSKFLSIHLRRKFHIWLDASLHLSKCCYLHSYCTLSILIRRRAGRLKTRGSIPGRNKRFFNSSFFRVITRRKVLWNHPTARNNPEDGRIYFNRGESLRSRITDFFTNIQSGSGTRVYRFLKVGFKNRFFYKCVKFENRVLK
jgi:hypothetical protein